MKKLLLFGLAGALMAACGTKKANEEVEIIKEWIDILEDL